ncbi:2OG-Fe(II) oxygenase [Fibrella sp. WM1]|uniref:2OG-Fe(II) oxygenase n=1 Tax=Fibrella musci TaxID=3242485 RepID=UPI00351FEB0E
MPKLFPYYRFENFLSKEIVNELYDYVLANEHNFKPSKVNHGTAVDPTAKQSSSLFAMGKFADVFEKALTDNEAAIFQAAGVAPFPVRKHELNIAAFGDGGHFREHIDINDKTLIQDMRVVTAVYYFFAKPKQFEGGELIMYPVDFLPGSDKPVTISPVSNSLLVFSSVAPHSVAPVRAPNLAFKDYRFSVNCWFIK